MGAPVAPVPREGRVTREPLVTGFGVIFIFFYFVFSKFSIMSQKTFIIRNYVVFFTKAILPEMCQKD